MKEATIQLTTTNPQGEEQQTEVGLAYCFATEIVYKDLAGEEIADFMQEAGVALSNETPRMPDVKKTIYVILAAAMAYAQGKGIELPLRDADLMNHATPEQIGTALGTVIALRTKFYNMPVGEPEGKPAKKGSKRKNR